jgi:hypothetical protein
MAAMQDPKIQQIVGQSPFAQVIMGAMQSHITEHVALQYRREIEKQLGVPLPDQDAELPEDVEADLSRLVAAAAAKLLQKDQAEAQQQQQQEEAQNPLNIIQQKELQLKEQELQHKIQMDQAELQIKSQTSMANVQVQKDRLNAEDQREAARINARIAEMKSKEEQNAASMALEVAKELNKPNG